MFFCLFVFTFSWKKVTEKKLMQIFKRVILIRSNTRMYHAITCFWSRSKTIKSHLLVVFCPEPYQVFYRLFWGLTHSWQWHNLDNRISKFHFYACLQRFRPLTTYYVWARPKNTKYYLIWGRMTLLYDVFDKG